MDYELKRILSIPDTNRPFTKGEVLYDLATIINHIGNELKIDNSRLIVVIGQPGGTYRFHLDEFKENWPSTNTINEYSFSIFMTVPSDTRLYIGISRSTTDQDKSVYISAQGGSLSVAMETVIDEIESRRDLYRDGMQMIESDQKIIPVSITSSEGERKYNESKSNQGEKSRRKFDLKIAIFGGACAIVGAILTAIIQHFLH